MCCRRNGFTLIEMMIAVAISTVVLGAVLVMLSGVWLIAKESTDELQGALHLCSVRERLYRHLMKVDGTTYGLRAATNVSVSAGGELIANFEDGKNFPADADAAAAKAIEDALDTRSGLEYAAAGAPIQFVYITGTPRKDVTGYARLMISIESTNTYTWAAVKDGFQ